MSTATATQTQLTVDRKILVKALEKLNRVLANRTCKPVLQHIRMDAADGKLWLAATDLETSLALHVPAEGEMPRCLAPCKELLQRVKTGSAKNCQLWREEEYLIVNGGSVHHRLLTMPPEEYPNVPVRPEGTMLTLQAAGFRDDLKIVLVGVANQAPALHYLVGAIIVTGMVATWITVRAVMTPKPGDRQ